MTDIASPQPRISSHPGSLYEAEHLADLASRGTNEGFYGRMLRDDLRKERYAFKMSFDPDGLEWSRASELMFALLNDFNRSDYGRDPASIVCEMAVGLLEESMEGKALLLELYSLPSDHNRAKRQAQRQETTDESGASLPSLGLVPNWSVKKTRAGYIQVSPADQQQTIAVPKSVVHALKLSRKCRISWRRASSGLQLVDAAKLLDSEVDRLSWDGYSFSDVVAAQNLAVASSTAQIGWDGRGTFAESVTSPYMTFRRLRFTKFWIEALQEAVAFLNRFTTSESLYGEDAFSFSLRGLPSASDLHQAMDNIRSGTLTVGEAHTSYLFPKYSEPRSHSRQMD